jgi:hypothetical protein
MASRWDVKRTETCPLKDLLYDMTLGKTFQGPNFHVNWAAALSPQFLLSSNTAGQEM